MPTTTIRVDTAVLNELERRIESFSDTPNSVLRRLLGLSTAPPSGPAGHVTDGGGFRRGRRRGSVIGRTQDREFRQAILQTLVEMGGSGKTGEILDRVGEKLASRLTPTDYQSLMTGEVRWRNTAKFERKHLLHEGLLEPSTHGIWTISKEGRRALAKESKTPPQPAKPAPEFSLKRPEKLDLAAAREMADRLIRENIDWLREMAKR
jgi:hypothetical protein